MQLFVSQVHPLEGRVEYPKQVQDYIEVLFL
jgi:hypothetical protein